MFSLELKKQRESRGLSQYKLAQQLGVSQATVGMWESGKRDPSFPVLRTICEFFGVSADQFLGLQTSEVVKRPVQPALSSADAELLRKFHALDDMAQARILNSLDFEYQAAIPHEGSEKIPGILGFTMPAFIVYESANFDTEKQARAYIKRRGG